MWFHPASNMGFNPAFNMGGQPSVDGGGIVPTALSGLQLWLDAADTSTIVSSSNLVSQWNDKSGNGNNATQGTGSAQPTTGSATQNGKNVLSFDGGDTLVLPSALYSISNTGNTIFYVSKSTNNSSQSRVFTAKDSGNSRLKGQYGTTAGAGSATISAFANANNTAAGVEATGTNTNWQIFSCTFNGTTGQSLSINGGTASTDTGGAAFTATEFFIGSQSGTVAFFTGPLAEILIYNRSLPDTERYIINRYLGAKWGIAIA